MLDNQSSDQLRKEEVIQWALRTNRSGVPIVGQPSHSALRNKSSSNLRAILMSLSVVPHAEKPGKHSATNRTARVTGLDVKCFLLSALSVVRKPKCHSSLAKVDRYIAAIATVRSDKANNTSFILRTNLGWSIRQFSGTSSPHY